MVVVAKVTVEKGVAVVMDDYVTVTKEWVVETAKVAETRAHRFG